MDDDLNTPAVIELIRKVDRMAKERLENESETIKEGIMETIFALRHKIIRIFYLSELTEHFLISSKLLSPSTCNPG